MFLQTIILKTMKWKTVHLQSGSEQQSYPIIDYHRVYPDDVNEEEENNIEVSYIDHEVCFNRWRSTSGIITFSVYVTNLSKTSDTQQDVTETVIRYLLKELSEDEHFICFLGYNTFDEYYKLEFSITCYDLTKLNEYRNKLLGKLQDEFQSEAVHCTLEISGSDLSQWLEYTLLDCRYLVSRCYSNCWWCIKNSLNWTTV